MRFGNRLFIALAILIFIIASFLYIKVIKIDKTKKVSDDKLNYHISLAQSNFGVDFFAIDDIDERNYLYEKCIGEVSAVAVLSEGTSIESENDIIDIAYKDLYVTMIDKKYRNQIMGDSKTIYDIMTKINLNPYNEAATKELSDFVWNLRK